MTKSIESYLNDELAFDASDFESREAVGEYFTESNFALMFGFENDAGLVYSLYDLREKALDIWDLQDGK